MSNHPTKCLLDIYLPLDANSAVKHQNLRKLSKDCKFKAVSAEQYRDEMLRDAFINGLLSPEIRQRLLENDKLTMDSAFDKASSMDVAQRNASAYSSPVSHVAAASAPPPPPPPHLNLHPYKRWRVVLLNYHPWLLLTKENSLSATFVVVAVIMSDVIALLVRLFVVTVESEGTIPNAACQRRKVLALWLLSILHYVLLVLLPHFHQIYKMQEHLCSSMDILSLLLSTLVALTAS